MNTTTEALAQAVQQLLQTLNHASTQRYDEMCWDAIEWERVREAESALNAYRATQSPADGDNHEQETQD
ncbi:MAG TPA: hypothetical protein VIN03_11840 [Roseateles sp.]